MSLLPRKARKLCFSAVAQICCMTEFSQGWERPFCADKHSTGRSLTDCLTNRVHVTNNSRRRQLNLHKTKASALMEIVSSLNFEKKKKYESIPLNKIRDMQLSAFDLLRL